MPAIPNLDAMSRSDLMAFWNRCRRAKLAQADKLGVSVKVCGTLAAYACAKACAMRHRGEGDLQGARVYEDHCEIYYKSLPASARW